MSSLIDHFRGETNGRDAVQVKKPVIAAGIVADVSEVLVLSAVDLQAKLLGRNEEIQIYGAVAVLNDLLWHINTTEIIEDVGDNHLTIAAPG